MKWLGFILLLCLLPILLLFQISPENDPSSFGVPILLLDSLQLTLSSKLLLDIYSPRIFTLKGYLGWMPKDSNVSYSSCSGTESPTGSICLNYGKDMTLLVTQEDLDSCEESSRTCHSVGCHKIMWKNHMSGAMDCFVLGEDHWYGSGLVLSQRWPLQSDSRSWYPTVTGDPLHHPSGNVVENLWLSSSGFVIHVDHNVPLFVSFNESGSGKLCFSTSTKKHPYKGVPENQELSYSICSAASLKEAHQFSVHRWMKRPTHSVDVELFRYPIWSTWARFKNSIHGQLVKDFSDEIQSRGFPIGQLEIDDMWEDCYGDLEFNDTSFPDVHGLIRDVQVPVSLWVHPFCNTNCKCYEKGKELNFWVKNKDGSVLDVEWWNGIASVLDTTNKEAVRWFTERLDLLRVRYGVASFKFDAGEVFWFAAEFKFNDTVSTAQPNLFSKHYSQLAASFGNRVEARVGFETQDLPILVRMIDKYSRWDYANGLKTLIPSMLQLSMMGYYFILPDMVGGNNYDNPSNLLPDRELYIRWLEVNVFFPFIQFSISPWDYDQEVVRVSEKMLDLRSKYTSYMIQLAEQSVITGEPIVRPLWWISSEDPECLVNDSEFLLGDEILVAPVLSKGRRKRNIYLPDGIWTDVQRGKKYDGSQWLYDYDVPLDYLPYFTANLQ